MEWARPPFQRCIDYIKEADGLLHLCRHGLSHVSSMPKLVQALAQLALSTGEKELDMAETEARATFAQEEVNKGFPVLHAHTTVALWAALESLVEDLAVVWLLNMPAVLNGGQFARLKIRLADYERLEKQDRMIFLVKEFARSTNADLKLGITKLETLLDALGLSGVVDQDLRRTLFELSQVRNVIVHRAGVIDRRFKDACPWLNAEIGSRFEIDHKTYVRYYQAVHDYVLCLIDRVLAHFGIKPATGKSSGDA